MRWIPSWPTTRASSSRIQKRTSSDPTQPRTCSAARATSTGGSRPMYTRSSATRVQRLVLDLPKRYETVARLGHLSSTGDPEGEIVATGRVPPDPPPLPTGEVRQRPPLYSAVKVAGERAYRRARRGESFELPERTVHVQRFEQLWREGDRAAFAIECSSGTYVRSLIADLGDAYCESLRRTGLGPFDVASAP